MLIIEPPLLPGSSANGLPAMAAVADTIRSIPDNVRSNRLVAVERTFQDAEKAEQHADGPL